MNIRNNLSLFYDFYIVAKEKSFSRAAEKYYTSQSSLSRNIKRLEEEVGVMLLNRNNKGITLTSDGVEMFNRLDVTIGNLNILNNEEVRGTISIGTTRNIADNMLSKYLIKLNQMYPNIRVKIWIDSASNLIKMLNNRDINVLVDYLPIDTNDNLKVESIGKFKTYFACSYDFYKSEGNKIKKLKDLGNCKLVIPGKSRRRDALNKLLQESGIELTAMLEMPDSKLMADFVKETNFIGYFIEDEINDYNLKKLELEEELPENIIGIIYYKNLINKATKLFIELVKELG